MSEQLVTYIAEMQEEEALALAKELLDAGTPPAQILDDCRAAMTIVGKRFEEGQYFIPELILAGEMLKSISAEVRPRMVGSHDVKKGARVLVGTVKGDIHDIGKDIVAFMLDVSNFQIQDLGVDVPAEAFVRGIRDFQPDVVGMSGFLTQAFDQMRLTVAAMREAGLRDSVKIMIGGATMDASVAGYIGADAYGADALAAVRLVKGWGKGG